MDNKGGLRIVGKGGGDKKGAADDESQELVATGLYYVTPSDAWDDTTLSGRRVYTRLITLPMYILRELLKGVFLSLAVFSVILLAVFAGQVMRDGIGVVTLILVLPNFLPLICPFVLPLAIITGILICYSRLAKDNEILAAYAGGVNPFWLMLPAILTSIIAIFVTLTLNELVMTQAVQNIQDLVVKDQANILRRMISRPGNITVPTGEEYLAMSKLDPSRDVSSGSAALDITRFSTVEGEAEDSFPWDSRYFYPTKRVVARGHQVQEFADSADDEMILKMHVTKPVFQDLHSTDINKTSIFAGESGEERIMLSGRPSVTIHTNRSSFWRILQLAESRRAAESELRELELSMERNLDRPLAQRQYEQDRLLNLKRRINNRISEVHMRLALCFSCFAFAILGIPLGMRTRGTIVASFVVGIATAGVFFLALKTAEAQVAGGKMPFWVLWIPDAAVVILGIVLWLWNSRRS